MKKIPLTQGKWAKVDDKDYAYLNEFSWCVSGHRPNRTSYAVTEIEGKTVMMHRLLMNPPKGMVIDHINHDPLDNRRKNLRICTQSQNLMNSSLSRANVSGFKGVSWFKKRMVWKASICVDGKNKHLGYFKNKEDAARAYNKAARNLFGKLVYINKFPRKKRALDPDKSSPDAGREREV